MTFNWLAIFQGGLAGGIVAVTYVAIAGAFRRTDRRRRFHRQAEKAGYYQPPF